MPTRLATALILLSGALSLVACADASGPSSVPAGVPPPIRDGSVAAEEACVAAVDTNFGRSVATVTESISSEAGTSVTLSAEGEIFRCIASSDGIVADLRAVT